MKRKEKFYFLNCGLFLHKNNIYLNQSSLCVFHYYNQLLNQLLCLFPVHKIIIRASYFLDENPTRSALYGDLTRIVTTNAPTKMKPDETIGLNDLNQNGPNCTLLSESNQYQTKEEDRWDKFIECLLFFCCVA